MSTILNKLEQNVTLGSFSGQNNTIKDLYGDNSLSFYYKTEGHSDGNKSFYDVKQDGALPTSSQAIEDAKSNFKNTYGTITENSSQLGFTDSNRGYEIYHVENDYNIGAIYFTPEGIQKYNNMVRDFEREWKNYQKALDEYNRNPDSGNEKPKKPDYPKFTFSYTYTDTDTGTIQRGSYFEEWYGKLKFNLRLNNDGKMQKMVIFKKEASAASLAKWGNDSVSDSKDITIVIGGNTWEDEPATKVGGPTGKKGTKNYAGMLVELYEKSDFDFNQGHGGQNVGGTRIGITTTDENGNYRFINLNPFMKYYVVFTYNGQLYQATKYTDNLSGGYSNASEINRTGFNNKFSTINATPNNYNGNRRAFPYKATISKTSNTTLEALWGGDEGTGGFRKTVVNPTTLTQYNFKQQSRSRDYTEGYNYLENNGNKDVKQYVQDCMISAKTRTYPVYNHFAIEDLNNPPSKSNIRNSYKGWDYLYTKESDQARYVDFGVYRRETSEVALQKDLYTARVIVNGKEHTYKYNKRDPESLKNDNWVINLRSSDVAYHESYTRPLRKSEYLYDSAVYNNADYENGNKNLQMYVTYRITVLNRSQSIPLTINEIVDYYESKYFDFVSASTDPEGKNHISTSDTSTTGNNAKKLQSKGFSAKYITQKITLQPGDLNSIYITFKVKNDPNTQRVMLDLNTVGKRNIAEIDGYYNNKGIVDTFSNPGNLEASDIDSNGNINKDKRIYEPDCDKAPNLKVIIDKDNDREVKGLVFEDARTKAINNAVIGDGLFNNETKVNGVKVELVELVSEVNSEGIATGKYLGEKVWDSVTYTSLKGNPNKDGSRYSSGSGKAKIILSGASSLLNGALVVSNNDTLGEGEYAFKSVPPGDFFIRFTYGDHTDTVLANTNNEVTNLIGTKGKNAKSYNGQDYKSTIYQEGISQNGSYNGINGYKNYNGQNNPNYNSKGSLYYYDIAESNKVRASDAKDIYSDREKANNWSKGANGNTLLNNRAETLASFEKLGTVAKALTSNSNATAQDKATAKDQQNKMIQDLINNTKMVSQTGVIATEIEYNGMDRKMNNDKEYENGGKAKNYIIRDVDLGLVERPRAQLKLNKEITNIKISLASGNVIFNSNQSVNNLYFKQHQGHSPIYGGTRKLLLDNVKLGNNKETSPELIQAYMDEELIAGSTIEATYRLTVENVGEVDYLEPEFYYRGTNGKTVSKTRANKVIDYVSNLIEYDSKNNNGWTVQNASQIIPSTTLDSRGNTTTNDTKIDSDLVNRIYIKPISTYNRTIITDRLNAELVPEKVGNGTHTTSTTLILTKTLANTSGDEEFIYNNLAEIVETSNEQGRRMQFSIAGNQEMADQSIKTNNADANAKTAIKVIEPAEIDADSAQKIVILPPTGANKNIIIISIAVISALAIVACGIVAIRKILGKK